MRFRNLLRLTRTRGLRREVEALANRLNLQEFLMTQLAVDTLASAKALKAQVDAMQERQAKVEQMLADILDNEPEMSEEDIATLTEAKELLAAEAADVEADNADSPANPVEPPPAETPTE